jgi:phytoene/squalene synthetase
MRPATNIVGAIFRVTDDFRDDEQRKAGKALERKVEERRAWLAELEGSSPQPIARDDSNVTLLFGSAAK